MAPGRQPVAVRRILVIGGPGSGRRTLAAEIAGMSGLPVVAPGVPGEGPEAGAQIAAALEAARRPDWIIATAAPAAWPHLAARGHLVVAIDLPVERRLWRLARQRVLHGERDTDWQAARSYDPAPALRLAAACHGRGTPRCVLLRSPAAVSWFARAYPARFATVP
ncbi:hypothetical protein [Poseidonocella sp. HB161398]|uniref:hypothetical protein n=1 Tax=Poseidonocella sp. HB161398 TaxID=2320855 RepID=UPI001108FF8B|nr:hypothetical protein [Poseidonocella sp. HB161398]